MTATLTLDQRKIINLHEELRMARDEILRLKKTGNVRLRR